MSNVCVICSNVFSSHDPAEKYPNAIKGCLHAFHAQCLKEWLAKSSTCPVCRIPCADEPDKMIRLYLVDTSGFDQTPDEKCDAKDSESEELQDPANSSKKLCTQKVGSTPLDVVLGDLLESSPIPDQQAADQIQTAFDLNAAVPQPGTSNMLNPDNQSIPMTLHSAAVAVKKQEPMKASALEAAKPDEEKQSLGERLYPLVKSMYPNIAPKITGMLLEIDNSDLIQMLDHAESLKLAIEEAAAVWHDHQQKTNNSKIE